MAWRASAALADPFASTTMAPTTRNCQPVQRQKAAKAAWKGNVTMRSDSLGGLKVSHDGPGQTEAGWAAGCSIAICYKGLIQGRIRLLGGRWASRSCRIWC